MRLYPFLLLLVLLGASAHAEGIVDTSLSPEQQRAKIQSIKKCMRQLLSHESEPAMAEDIGDSAGQPAISELMQSGQARTLEEAFALSPVPKWARRFFDPESGKFNYKNEHPFELSVENGDAELKALRLNWSREEGLSEKYFDELMPVMKKMPKLQLWIVAKKIRFSEVKERIKSQVSDIQKRITLMGEALGWLSDIEGFIWSQDGSKPLANGQTVMPPSWSSHVHGSYRHLTPRLNAFRGLRNRRSRFEFAGGNMVVGARNLFVGARIVNSVMETLQVTRDEAISALSAEFGKEVVEIGIPLSGPGGRKIQAEFHIDLDMAVLRNRVTGKEEILLSSPRKAIEELLAGRDVDSLPDQEVDFLQALRSMLSKGGDEAASEKIKKRFMETMGESLLDAERNLNDMIWAQRVYDTMGADLEKRGYEVVPIPSFYMRFNYANMIFSKEFAFLPHLGVPPWDRYMNRILRERGYEPLTFTVVRESLCRSGGLRCMSETYRRTPRPRASRGE